MEKQLDAYADAEVWATRALMLLADRCDLYYRRFLQWDPNGFQGEATHDGGMNLTQAHTCNPVPSAQLAALGGI